MGVMGCGRYKCDSTMCNHTIELEGYGYICYDCLDELKERQKLNPGMNIQDIEKFMESPKQFESEYMQPLIDLEKFCPSIQTS